MRVSRRAITLGTLATAIAVAVPMTLAATTSNAQPANKAVAAGAALADFKPGDAGPILSATFKTSKPEDLLISLSLECSILTDVVVPGSDAAAGPGEDPVTSEGQARGAVRVWLELDGQVVKIEDASAPPQSADGHGGNQTTDSVTFCDRLHKRSVTDRENDGIDKSEDWLDTKTANAFNWVRLNAGSGTHTLVAKAAFDFTGTSAPSTASAYVGKRTMVIEPTKLANNAVISDTARG
jgi:hypothetical protein